jgi:hypothetical protein
MGYRCLQCTSELAALLFSEKTIERFETLADAAKSRSPAIANCGTMESLRFPKFLILMRSLVARVVTQRLLIERILTPRVR